MNVFAYVEGQLKSLGDQAKRLAAAMGSMAERMEVSSTASDDEPEPVNTPAAVNGHGAPPAAKRDRTTKLR